MPPTIGAAMGFITSTPHLSPTGSAQGSPEQPPRSSIWGASALDGAFDGGLLNVGALQDGSGG
jgi:hypothetical protein